MRAPRLGGHVAFLPPANHRFSGMLVGCLLVDAIGGIFHSVSLVVGTASSATR